MKYYNLQSKSFHSVFSVIVVANDKSEAIKKYISHIERNKPDVLDQLSGNITVNYICTEAQIIR